MNQLKKNNNNSTSLILFFPSTSSSPTPPGRSDKHADNNSAAWTAYYSQYYDQNQGSGAQTNSSPQIKDSSAAAAPSKLLHQRPLETIIMMRLTFPVDKLKISSVLWCIYDVTPHVCPESILTISLHVLLVRETWHVCTKSMIHIAERRKRESKFIPYAFCFDWLTYIFIWLGFSP